MKSDQKVRHDRCSKTYPFQVTVYHPLVVHVYKPPGDVFELPGRSLVKGVTGDKSEGLRVQTDRRQRGTG